MPQSITVRKLLHRMEYELQLSVVAGKAGLDQAIAIAELNRPGLALCGYYDHFARERIQVFGDGEIAYLNHLSSEERSQIFRQFFSYRTPCVVVTRGLDPPEEMVKEAAQTQTPLCVTTLTTPVFARRLLLFLEDEFGPFEIVHGDFVEVYGIGVLILGDSGIGKSECALELIRRGHRIIADDAVLIKRVSGHRIFGTSAHVLKHYMEVRGLGIIDVLTLFGATAVRSRKRVELVVRLELWDEEKEYNRSGLDDETYPVLGERVPYVLVPVQPGRNTSIIVEVAAMGLRARKMGRHSAKEFNDALIEQMQTKRAEFELEIDEWDDELGF